MNTEDLDMFIIYDEKLRIGLLSAKFGPKFIILYTLLDNPLNYKRMTWDLTVHRSYLSPRIFTAIPRTEADFKCNLHFVGPYVNKSSCSE